MKEVTKMEQRFFLVKTDKDLEKQNQVIKLATKVFLNFPFPSSMFIDKSTKENITNEIENIITSLMSQIPLKEVDAIYTEAYGNSFIPNTLYISDYYNQFKLIPFENYPRYVASHEILDIYNLLTSNLNIKEMSIYFSKINNAITTNKFESEKQNLKAKFEYDQNKSFEIINSLDLKSSDILKPENKDGYYPYATSIDEVNNLVNIARISNLTRFTQNFESNISSYYKFLTSAKSSNIGLNYSTTNKNEVKYNLKISCLF